MKLKWKIIIPVFIVGLLTLGSTTNFVDAASTSTSKIISQLKKQVASLKKSNSAKDKEIKKLKAQIKANNKDIALLNKKNSDSNLRYVKLNRSYSDLKTKNNELTKRLDSEKRTREKYYKMYREEYDKAFYLNTLYKDLKIEHEQVKGERDFYRDKWVACQLDPTKCTND